MARAFLRSAQLVNRLNGDRDRATSTMGVHLPLVALARSPFAGWRERLMVTQLHSNYFDVSSIPNLLTEDIPAKTQAFFHKALLPTVADSDLVDLFSERLKLPMSRLPFPMDVAACAAGLLHTIWAVNKWLLPQVAVPCLKLACNAWHFGVVGRVRPFCSGPTADSFAHFIQYTEMVGMVQEALPRFAWAPTQPGRVLELFGVGADAPRLVLIGTVLDGLWAALVAHKRSARAAQGTFKARPNHLIIRFFAPWSIHRCAAAMAGK